MEIILKYFPNLSDQQKQQFAALDLLYHEWNEQINVISRKDINELYERHVLHSLAISQVVKFTKGSQVLDVGTGGGFPALPLAIMFPDSEFTACDSIGKKIKVVQEVSRAIDLKNLSAIHANVKQVKDQFDFVISRAVMKLDKFVPLVRKNILRQQRNAVPNGIVYLKGGDLTEELAPFNDRAEVFDISKHFEEEFFETKKIVFLPV